MKQYIEVQDILSVNEPLEDLDSTSLQLGSVEGDGYVEYSECEYYQQPGLHSLPANPNPGKDACQAVVIPERDYSMVIATRDIRQGHLIEELGPGEVQIFASGPENKEICKIVLKNNSEEESPISEDNQKVIITVNNTVVEILSSGKVNIKADEVNISEATDYASLASLVDANFQALKTTISGAATGDAIPGLVGALTLPSTKCNNVKIS